MLVLSLSLVFEVLFFVCLVVFWLAVFDWCVGSVGFLDSDLVDLVDLVFVLPLGFLEDLIVVWWWLALGKAQFACVKSSYGSWLDL